MPFYISPETTIDILKIFTLGTLSFFLAFASIPFLLKFLYRHQLWRKKVRGKAIDGKDLYFFKKFHAKGETQIPRFGGLLIWLTPLFLATLFFFLSKTGIFWFEKLNFLSRSQTWLLFFALISACLLGLTDDILQVIERPSRPFFRKIWDRIKKYKGYQFEYLLLLEYVMYSILI